MMRRVSVLFALFAMIVVSQGAANPQPALEPQWSASPPIVPTSTPIALTICNTTAEIIRISSTAPWWITDASDNYIAGPGVALTMIVDIPPGGCIPWSWSQEDTSGSQVLPGDYKAKIRWKFEGEPEWTIGEAPIRVMGGPHWEAMPDWVYDGDTLALMLENHSDTLFQLSNDAPWSVTDLDGTPVWAPPANPIPTDLFPWSSLDWNWEATIGPGGPGMPSYYYAVIDFFDENTDFHFYFEDMFTVIDNAGEVLWYVDPPVNSTNSVVGLHFTNATADSVYLPNLAPWWITDDNDSTIFYPFSGQAIVPVPPGGSMAWAWDERDNEGNPVPGGSYTAHVNYYPNDPTKATTELTFDFVLVEPEKSPGCNFVETDQQAYDEGDPVAITFTNCVPDTVGMVAQYTWWITNQFGLPVHAPWVLWAHARFDTMEQLALSWDQLDFSESQVLPGFYVVHVGFTDENYFTRYVVSSLPFFIGDVTGVAESRPPSVDFLGQNFPNPFNPLTTIQYSNAERGLVNLHVYDISGRVVATLVDEVQDSRAGGYQVTWDGTDDNGRAVGSGTYFYRLVTERSRRSGKLTLLR